MREIKVRGWHTVQKKMYSAEEMAADQLTLLPTGCFINVSGEDTRLSEIYPKDIFIPLLFIGLEDKNGKEIYDGDIVRVESQCGSWKENMPVTFYHGGFKFQSKGHAALIELDIGIFCNHTHKDPTILESFKVIGNIYENPELLEVKNDSC